MKKLDKLVVATRNQAKVQYYSVILKEIAHEVIGLDDIGIVGKPSETGKTAEENAEIKAKYYVEKTELPVFSEDEALYIDFLPKSKQPGTHVRRVNGIDEVDDEKLLQYWEKLVAKTPPAKRTGRWHTAYCLVLPNKIIKTFALDHPTMFFYPTSKVRTPGWPLSSLQGNPEFGKPHSEQTDAEKAVSKSRLADELMKALRLLV